MLLVVGPPQQMKKDAFEFLHEPLRLAIQRAGFTAPTLIQQRMIPPALVGKNVTGIAKTGRGKTVAYVLPILNRLLEEPRAFFALVLGPTRELCLQIGEEFNKFGGQVGLRVSVLVGGTEPSAQQLALSRGPHVIVGTPSCILFHLERTRGFTLSNVRMVVLDEADRLLDLQFEQQTTQVLRAVPQERQTLFLTATMNRDVRRLQEETTGGVLIDLVKEEMLQEKRDAAKDGETIQRSGAVNKELRQKKLFIKPTERTEALLKVLYDLQGPKIVFCESRDEVRRISLVLKQLYGEHTFALFGEMLQADRTAQVDKFKQTIQEFTGDTAAPVLVSTDVAARGIDIVGVEAVINYKLPLSSEEYLHRVGRTARAGAFGVAITLLAPSDEDRFFPIHRRAGGQWEEENIDPAVVDKFRAPVERATGAARRVMLGRMAENELACRPLQ